MTTATTTDHGRRGEPRELDGIYRAPGLHWVGDGFRVAGYFRAIPDAVRKLNPFLLLDYHPAYDYAPTKHARGVGVHPHRGFETVTLAWQGRVAHHDSSGGGGVIGPGDVQWMTAASGILHKEYHEATYARQGGPFQMAQLWVNLPRAHKMARPRYQALVADQMGLVTLPNDAGVVRIVAGEFQGVKGPARTYTPINVFDVRLNARGNVEFTFPAHQNTSLLVMEGDITINDETKATAHDFVVFANIGERVVIEAREKAHLLVLNGEPIHEPVVQYGPFVMNSEREIAQALADFDSGKFGYLD
ncbi:pirin family protein [Polyangium jinanense]|uniref:Pirin family protein n=1 Tax=Polyangium jinanense TaxID=2829994 RepID=A0A9X3X927_9BACT|nr:pirin family protein [Polyangium jinanense]MDC3960011.1 pirin family protein [Polyangium jinanense]MDC3986229.1 pirin family protein [Polyangium jinanense]